jgi:energy-coupling factor transporter transmembrane protein EcfT
MVASNVHIFLSFIVCFIVLLCSFMVYFISWYLLICFFCSFLFIHVHLFSCLFLFSHFLSFLFIFFFFFLFPFFLEKTITNLNHLHVDPRLSSAAKPVISAKSIPTAPMDPISCPANHIWRYPKCAEVCRSVPKCAEVLTFVESTCLQCLPNHSQRNGSHRKGPVLHWAIQLYWMSILNLFTSSLSSSVLGKPWHRS